MRNNFKLDLSDFSRELHLLIEIIKLDDNRSDQVINKDSCKGINWNQFLQLAKHHRVYPIIHINIKKLKNDWFPLFVIQELSLLYQNNTFQMMFLSGEMEQLSRLFTDSRVRTLFLKGPVLSNALYGDVSLRTSNDLDIMVPMENLGKAEEILLQNGYIKDDYIESVLNDWKWRHHHITFFHPEKRIKLEVHWRLNPGPAKEPKFEELWERKRRSTLFSYPVFYLGFEDLFFFLVTHGARHGWSRLRWLVDIVKMTKQDLNWKEVLTLLTKYQCLQVGGQSLILTSQLLNSKLNGEMANIIKGNQSKRLAQDALFYIKQLVNLHTEPLPQDVANHHKRHLFLLMSNRQKLLFIFSFLYPFPIDAETLPLPKVLHILYFPLRPFLLLWRKTRNRSIARRA
ncbi:nucleotidyltransferase family protein [Neobacillus sp. NPDC093182]|uniref:nucleotidyltransferase domain-containing protein n=1 Tax=Neobacillus sp. NPDC093182 TaxID=3364297 RepID=UPI00381FF775